MLTHLVDSAPAKSFSVPASEIEELASQTLLPEDPQNPPLTKKRQGGISKAAIRTSLKASTFDGIFSTTFGCVTGGVLLSNFLLQLGATNVEIGLLWAIPMVANFLQPVGAYFAERQTSRRKYNLLIFGISRLLWLILAVGIGLACWQHAHPHLLVQATLGVACATSIFSSLGSASWLSWMTALVPHRLRGRYFGLRNSASSLTSLLCVPLMGLAVSAWAGGTVQGYGVVLCVGVLAGLVSLGCQWFQADVNPQEQGCEEIREEGSRDEFNKESSSQTDNLSIEEQEESSSFSQESSSQKEDFSTKSSSTFILKDTNFLKFIFYLGLWTFAVNLGSPFFNIYLLKDLSLDVSWVTVYNSLSTGANLLMLMIWGKLADRVGNRALLILVGILVALTPLLWVATGNNLVSLWLWLPLLHVLGGGTWAAIDLCNNNIQMEIAPARQPSTYFAIAAAVAGVTGALGSTAGGFLAEFVNLGGLKGLFALSAVLRLVAIVPLVFVRERRATSLGHLMRIFFPLKPETVSVQEG